MGQTIGGNNATSSNESSEIINTYSQRNRIMQDILLVWLDQTINEETNRDCQKNVAQLRGILNNLKTFTDPDQCVNFLSKINDDKVCLIISGSLGHKTVPRVHDMSQVNSIMIFCGKITSHEQLAEQWPKVKGIFNNIYSLSEHLKEVVKQYETDAISPNILPRKTNDSTRNKISDQLDTSFMYTQILKEILLTIEYEEHHLDEFINFYYKMLPEGCKIDNNELSKQKYYDHTPIWWYASDHFLYLMLNGALRQMNMDAIIHMGFFVNALHHQIEHLHQQQLESHQFHNSFTVFRGQGLSRITFKELQKKNDTIISFNSFLSTSKNRNVSMGFARRALDNKDTVGILFVITIDPSKVTTPFAFINDDSYYGDKEYEILFSMHTVFRICEIKPIDKSPRLYQVNLILTSDNDNDRRELTDWIRERTAGSTGWNRLGQFVLNAGQPKKAEEVYQILLEQSVEVSQRGNILYQLGSSKYHQGKYIEAIESYQESLEIQQQSFPLDHSSLAKTYNKIGNAYGVLGQYSNALLSHEQALKVQEESLPLNHLDFAHSYDSIGSIYYYMHKYSEALPFHEQAFDIRKMSLSQNHPELAMSYNNIAMVHKALGEYSTAFTFYKLAVQIGQYSLPPNHPNLQMYKKRLNDIEKLI